MGKWREPLGVLFLYPSLTNKKMEQVNNLDQWKWQWFWNPQTDKIEPPADAEAICFSIRAA